MAEPKFAAHGYAWLLPPSDEPHGQSLDTISTVVEEETGYDSIATIERIYERTARDSIRCCFPRCQFRSRDAEKMWRHVHGVTGHHRTMVSDVVQRAIDNGVVFDA